MPSLELYWAHPLFHQFRTSSSNPLPLSYPVWGTTAVHRLSRFLNYYSLSPWPKHVARLKLPRQPQSVILAYSKFPLMTFNLQFVYIFALESDPSMAYRRPASRTHSRWAPHVRDPTSCRPRPSNKLFLNTQSSPTSADVGLLSFQRQAHRKLLRVQPGPR